jgi:hypothetical protein
LTSAGDEGSGISNKGLDQPKLREVLHETIHSLGGPISKTIMWQMSNRGVFSESTRVDVRAFYGNLKELVGPGADMIMDMTWQRLKKDYEGNYSLPSSGSSLDRIVTMAESSGGRR